MQPPILEAVRLIEDGRVQLEYVDDGQTWAVTFKGELGPDAGSRFALSGTTATSLTRSRFWPPRLSVRHGYGR